MRKIYTLLFLLLSAGTLRAQTNNWMWVSGDNTANENGVYGTKGAADAANKPGAREGAVSWKDAAGNLWLFGGYSRVHDLLNDLWRFNPSTGQWTWISGDNTSNQTGVYGTKGVAAITNKPGARREAVSWMDANNNLWLFGGIGVSNSNNVGSLNDLWRFDPATGQWTWVSGDNTLNQAGVYGTKGVAAITNKPGARYEAVSWKDATNNLWLYGGSGFNDLWRFNTGTNQWTWVSGDDDSYRNSFGNYGTKGVAAADNKPGGREGAVSWTDASGKLWLFGGVGIATSSGGRLNDLWRFDPGSEQWTWISGDNESHQEGIYGTKGVADASNRPEARKGSVSWIHKNGNLLLFGGESEMGDYNYNFNDLWQFNLCTPPAISGQPAPALQQLSQGSTPAAISVMASGDGLTYQWYSNKEKSNKNGTPIEGANKNSYTPPSTEGTIYYYVEVSNGCAPAAVSEVAEVTVSSLTTWYRDLDKDGFGNPDDPKQAAEQPDGYVADNTDCNDSDEKEHPGQTWFIDADGDGYTAFSQVAKTNGAGAANSPVAVSNMLIQCERPQHGKLDSELTGYDDCNDADEKEHPGQTWYMDADDDGYAAYSAPPVNSALTVSLASIAADPNVVESCTRPDGGKLASELTGFKDCNDNDKTVHPGATEIPGNTVDEDCDGIVLNTWYEDKDGDGFGNRNVTKTENTQPEGYVADNTDCDDTKVLYRDGDSDGFGSTTKVACDGVENNEDCNDAWRMYEDKDGDNHGSDKLVACDGVLMKGDCNDNDKNEKPGSRWYIDTDGDGYANGSTLTDQCARPVNGFLQVELKSVNGDCSEGDPTKWKVRELFKDSDEDGFTLLYGEYVCVGSTLPKGYQWERSAQDDCDDTNPAKWRRQYLFADADKDGYTTGSGSWVCIGTDIPDGYRDTRSSQDDCNDSNPSVWISKLLYRDADGDGFTTGGGEWICMGSMVPDGYRDTRSTQDDCNDSNRDLWIYKLLYRDADNDKFTTGGGSWVCMGSTVPEGYSETRSLQDDCNDNDKDQHPGQTWYIDADGDGYGLSGPAFGQEIASLPGPIGNGSVVSCTRPQNGFLLSEIKGVEDCDDTNKDAWRISMVYTDSDGDGYTVGSPQFRCVGDKAPDGFALVKSATDDCNDNNKDVHSKQTYYIDVDGDGYDNGTESFCQLTPPTGYSATTKGTDCDDANAARYPGATEIADNGIDEDCDDKDLKTWYQDADGDGFGNSAVSTTANDKPDGYVSDKQDCDDTKTTYADNDKDGFGAGAKTPCGVTTNTDCDDTDNTIYPGALDVPDGKDNDCNSTIDDGPQVPFYQDRDGDGFGNPKVMVMSSKPVNGYVRDNQDCDDNRISYRDADNDGWGTSEKIPCGWISRTGDCDDNDRRIHTKRSFYRDADGDKYGDPNKIVVLCTSIAPAGYTTNNTDCDDTNPTARVGTIFYADNDGDGFGDAKNYIIQCSYVAPRGYTNNNQDCDDSKITYADADGDGYGSNTKSACGVANNTDCNDNDRGVHTVQTFYRDSDGDGFGDAGNGTQACSSVAPAGFVSNSTDCNDSQVLYADGDGDGFGSSVKVPCGGVANSTDCDDAMITYTDADGDGFGSDQKAACGVANSIDCNDNLHLFQDNDGDGFGSTIAVPCNGVANNSDCNDALITYADGDNDGYGAGDKAPCGVTNNTDCNDADNKVHEMRTFYLDADGDGFGSAIAAQFCSLTQDGFATNNLDCDDSKRTYADLDGDGFGSSTLVACGVSNNTDCNDNDRTIYPGAVEIADGKDNNCDQQVDEGLSKTWYLDKDGDGFGNPKVSVVSNTQPRGYVDNNLDCDDNYITYEDKDNDGWGSSKMIPCSWIRRSGDCNDLDRRISSLRTWYKDNDGDKYGDPAKTLSVCQADAPAGYVSNNTDCNDNNAQIRSCPVVSTAAKKGEEKSTAQIAATISLAASPNPFAGVTQIQYSLPAEATVSLRVYDVLGREVKTVVEGTRAAGLHSASFAPQKTANGVYYLRLTVKTVDGKTYTQTQKLIKAG